MYTLILFKKFMVLKIFRFNIIFNYIIIKFMQFYVSETKCCKRVANKRPGICVYEF